MKIKRILSLFAIAASSIILASCVDGILTTSTISNPSSTTPNSTIPSSPVSTPNSTIPSSPVSTPNSTIPSTPVSTPNSTVPSTPVSTPNSTVPSSPVSTPSSTVPSTPSNTKPGDIPNSTTTPTVTNKYIVKFINTDILEQEIEENGFVQKPEDPTLDGYTFAGWYLDENFIIPFDFNTKITSNISLYPCFSLNTYTIIFEGTNINNAEVAHGKSISKPADPIKTDYKFVGWYTDNTYSQEFDFSQVITENTTIYAKFEKITKYTVTFIVDGEEYKSVSVNANTTVNKPTNPTKSGSKFVGWYSNLELTEEFSFTTKINSTTTLYAKFEEINYDEISINITNLSGYNEGLYVEFETIPDLNDSSDYNVYYKKEGESSYTQLDANLIRINESIVRADVLGLSAGNYTVKIEASMNNNDYVIETDSLQVTTFDRSGYAHFNYSSGVGAYNNDGTLKSGAVIIYVSEENKNTVTATIGGEKCTGIVSILGNQSKSSNPLVIRIIGRIGAATWNEIKYNGDPYANKLMKDSNGNIVSSKYSGNLNQDDIISAGINTLNTTTATILNGLDNRLKISSEYDSNFNMCNVSGAKNVTVEGVGPNAELFQWGFTWKTCNSIEVRNLTFTDYPEDACSFEGNSSNIKANGNYWVHNNTFNAGKNYWDVTDEQDKPAGDGATDFKYCKGITSSYNIFNKCKKTGLIGGSNDNLTMDVTFHHNYYNQVGSRLPLGRQANMHIYNNYYYECGTAQDIRANAFVLSESNYFEGVDSPQKVTNDSTYKGTAIKSYNDYFTGCGSSKATIVTSRTQAVSNTCKPDGSSDYSSFDTNSSQFYYDSTNQKSNVAVMTAVADVPTYVKANAGAMTGDFIPAGDSNVNNDNNNTQPENPDDNQPEDSPSITSSLMITFNDLTVGDKYSTNLTGNNYQVYATSEKTVTISSTEQTIEETSINKYVNLGGSGSSSYRCISFETTKKANITVYFSAGSAGRRIKLFTSSETISESSTTTQASNVIVNEKFSNVEAGSYLIASTNSGINIYCIKIEYIE